MAKDKVNEPLINPIPAPALILVALLCLPEIIFQMAENGLFSDPTAIGWRVEMAERFAFSDKIFDWMRLNNSYSFEHLLRFVTFPYIQQETFSLVLGAGLLLTFGKYICDNYHWSLLMIGWFAGTTGAALAYGLLVNEGGTLMGARSAAFSVIGIYSFTIFQEDVSAGKTPSRAIKLIAFMIVMQLMLVMVLPRGMSWVARLFSYLFGFAVSFFAMPNFKTRMIELRDLIRRD